jgi:hypothetical protein
MMRFDITWHFTCKQDKDSGETILENCKGMMTGRVMIESTGKGIVLRVVNSRNELTLLLETTRGNKEHAVVLAPRRSVLDARDGLAVYGVIDRKTSGYNPVYEYDSATGSDILRVVSDGFPRRMLVMKGNMEVAEIKKSPGEVSVKVYGQAKDKDVLIIIGIMLAVCILLPMQSTMPHGMVLPAILIA